MEPKRSRFSLAKSRASIDVTGMCIASCPFAGMAHDPGTPVGYPHPDNRCHRHKEAVKMRLQFQRTFCLSPDFADCSIYQQQDQPALPVVETQPTVTPRIQQRRGLAVAVVVVLIMFASLLSWPILTQIIDPEPSSLLPISLDPVFALIQDAPQMPAKSEIPPYEIQNDLHHDSGSFNQEPAAVSPAADPSVPAGATPQMNVRNGGFRAVTYPSD